MLVYVSIFRRYGTHHVIWGGDDRRCERELLGLGSMSMDISLAELAEQLKFNIDVSKMPK